MSQNGRKGANQLQPAPLGNRRAVTDGAYASFTPGDLEAGGGKLIVRLTQPVGGLLKRLVKR
jgi:hypothetical protein